MILRFQMPPSVRDPHLSTPFIQSLPFSHGTCPFNIVLWFCPFNTVPWPCPVNSPVPLFIPSTRSWTHPFYSLQHSFWPSSHSLVLFLYVPSPHQLGPSQTFHAPFSTAQRLLYSSSRVQWSLSSTKPQASSTTLTKLYTSSTTLTQPQASSTTSTQL